MIFCLAARAVVCRLSLPSHINSCVNGVTRVLLRFALFVQITVNVRGSNQTAVAVAVAVSVASCNICSCNINSHEAEL